MMVSGPGVSTEEAAEPAWRAQCSNQPSLGKESSRRAENGAGGTSNSREGASREHMSFPHQTGLPESGLCLPSDWGSLSQGCVFLIKLDLNWAS